MQIGGRLELHYFATPLLLLCLVAGGVPVSITILSGPIDLCASFSASITRIAVISM